MEIDNFQVTIDQDMLLCTYVTFERFMLNMNMNRKPQARQEFTGRVDLTILSLEKSAQFVETLSLSHAPALAILLFVVCF